MTVFRFVEREKAVYPVSCMCRLLGVSPSGFWAWAKRPPSARARSDAALTATIRDIHRDSRGTYGMPRVHAELRYTGTRCSRKRVARLMRSAGLEGVHRRRFVRTTSRDRDAAPAPDLVNRTFSAGRPNELWVADITYLPTWAGFLYLAAVVDVFSRRVVGWAMAGHLRTSLILDAIEMAISRRQPSAGLVHHSDRGTQYTSIAFGLRCREAGIAVSMGSTGDAYDNALAESFFASLETELIDRSSWRTRADARLAVFDYSRPSTTRAAGTPRSITYRPPSSRGGTVRRRSPPPDPTTFTVHESGSTPAVRCVARGSRPRRSGMGRRDDQVPTRAPTSIPNLSERARPREPVSSKSWTVAPRGTTRMAATHGCYFYSHR